MKHIPMTEKMYEYLLSVSLSETPVQKRVREETSRHPNSSLQIAPDQVSLLQMLARLVDAKKTLEVGVFLGYSSLAVALATPPDAVHYALELNEKWAETASGYWKEAGISHKIRLHLGRASENLDRLIGSGHEGTFDFAFVDANKEQYLEYYEACLKLLRKGGLMVFDNVLWAGKVIDREDRRLETEIIRKLNETASRDTRVSSSLVPIADGMLLVRKEG